VALKRIPDILSSPELARRVLREICILRRLRHPFIITLLDAFLTPSSTGTAL
jgi:mitogen-activated protein kinase 1/3